MAFGFALKLDGMDCFFVDCGRHCCCECCSPRPVVNALTSCTLAGVRNN